MSYKNILEKEFQALVYHISLQYASWFLSQPCAFCRSTNPTPNGPCPSQWGRRHTRRRSRRDRSRNSDQDQRRAFPLPLFLAIKWQGQFYSLSNITSYPSPTGHEVEKISTKVRQFNHKKVTPSQRLYARIFRGWRNFKHEKKMRVRNLRGDGRGEVSLSIILSSLSFGNLSSAFPFIRKK